MHGIISSSSENTEEKAPCGIAVGACATILCIEDNPLSAELITETLKARPGIKVLMAPNGQMGVHLACVHQPDLILLDLQLPDLNGEEVLHRLRGDARTSALQVIVISGGASSRDSQRLLSAGASGYMDKPFTTSHFLATLDRLLGFAQPLDR